MVILKSCKQTILPVFTILALIFTMSISARAQDNDPNLGIIPAPASLVKSPGMFVFSRSTVIRADKTKR